MAGLLVALLLAAFIAIQLPSVQTAVTGRILKKLSTEMDGSISYSSIALMPFNSLVVKDFLMKDNHPYTTDEFNRGWEAPSDTIASAREITATFTLKGLLSRNGLHFGRVTVKDGCFNLVSEPDSVYKVNITRVFRSPANNEKKEKNLSDIFDIRKVRVENFRYTMKSFKKGHDRVHPGMNYEDLDVLVHSLTGHALKYTGGRMYGTCDALRASEKSGYEVYECSASCIVGMGQTMIKDIHIKDNLSEVNANYYSMTYENAQSFSNYITDVVMECDLKKTLLSTSTITYTSGALANMSTVLNIESGHMKGSVSDFEVDGLVMSTTDGNVAGTFDGSVSGIPNVDEMRMNASFNRLKFNTKGLEDLIPNFVPGFNAKLSKFAPRETFDTKVQASGTLSRLVAGVNMKSTAGNMACDATILNLTGKKNIEIDGKVSTHSLNIGRLAGVKAIGECSLDTRAKATLGKDITARIDTLQIHSLHAKGHDYSNISAHGVLRNKIFSGSLRSNDSALKAVLDADVALDKKSTSRIDLDVRMADLHAMNLYTQGDTSIVSFKINSLLSADILDGSEVHVSDVVDVDSDGRYEIGGIDLTSEKSGDKVILAMNSRPLDARYVGDPNFKEFIQDLQAVTTRRHFPSLYKDQQEPSKLHDYTIDLSFHDSADILDYAFPGLFLADGTFANLTMDSKGRLQGTFNSPGIVYAGKSIRGLQFSTDNLYDNLSCTVLADKVEVGALEFSNLSLMAYGQDDNLNADIHYDNMSGLDNSCDLSLTGRIFRDEKDSLAIEAHPLHSTLAIGDKLWEFGESTIIASHDGISVDGFSLSSDEEVITVDGKISPVDRDTLLVKVGAFDIGIVNQVIDGMPKMEGTTEGRAELISPVGKNLALNAYLLMRNLKIAGNDVGTISIASDWDDTESRAHATMINMLGGHKVLSARTDYLPQDKTLDAEATMDGLNLAIVHPFLHEIFTEMGGTLSGSVKASGRTDRLSIGSESLSLNDARMRVAFTNVAYTLNGPLSIDDSGVHFDNVTLHDESNGHGILNGSLSYDHFKDMRLNARLSMDGLQAIDIPEQGNSGFYGTLAVTGTGSVSGPFNSLRVNADIATEGPGNVHVPLSSSASASSSNLLTFVQPMDEDIEDEISAAIQRTDKTAKTRTTAKGNHGTGLHATARVQVRPEVTALLEIDKTSGHVLSASGNADMMLDIHPARDLFSINGDYIISHGNYDFEIPGLASKDFSINEGSSIKFAGPLKESTLDIHATHKVKTTLSTLISDSTAVSTRRIVECGLAITDKLKEPKLSFSINVPDLDPNTKAEVEAALNTEDKVQKQFVALLLLGTFLPSEQSGVVNGSNMLYSNMSEIVASQFNNILQKLEIPVDLGFGYQQNQGGTDIFDVAVSTQLFNNRVVVNGSVGNRKYKTSTSANGDMVGDLDIEIKIDRSGRLRLNLFSHSADEFTSALDYSQRNGVGITYQKEFRTFGELIRNAFTPRKKKRDLLEQEAIEESRKRANRTIIIEE